MKLKVARLPEKFRHTPTTGVEFATKYSPGETDPFNLNYLFATPIILHLAIHKMIVFFAQRSYLYCIPWSASNYWERHHRIVNGNIILDVLLRRACRSVRKGCKSDNRCTLEEVRKLLRGWQQRYLDDLKPLCSIAPFGRVLIQSKNLVFKTNRDTKWDVVIGFLIKIYYREWLKVQKK